MENPLSDYLVVGAESFNPNNRFIVLLSPLLSLQPSDYSTQSGNVSVLWRSNVADQLRSASLVIVSK